jgi:hypothetical protein
MSEIKPNANGTCSPDCPSYTLLDTGGELIPVCTANGDHVTGEDEHCHPGHERLQAALDAARRLRSAASPSDIDRALADLDAALDKVKP